MALTAHQSQFVLEKALADKKLSRRDVDRYLAMMPEEISALEARLAALKGLAATVAEGVTKTLRGRRAANREKAPPPTKAKKTSPVSPETLASRQLQGRYIAAIRNVPKTQRAKYQKLAKESGRQAAIDAIQKAAAKIEPSRKKKRSS